LAKARQRLNDAALAAAVYSVDKPGEKLPPEGLAVLHAAQLIAQASKQLIPQLEAKAQKACSKQQTASAPPPAQPPAGGGAPPPLPPIAMNTPPQYPPAQPPPPGGSSGGTGSPGAPACTQPPPPPAYPPCSSFPGAKQYTCTRKKADGSPDPEYHCLYPDAVPEAARICGQASDPKYAGKWTEGGSPPPAAANAQCSTPPKVYADLNLKPPAAEVQACESKPPFLPWGGHGSATITVSGGKPCGIGWHDTGATILDSMSVSSSPSHGSLKPQDQHVIVFTPAPGYKGQDSFTLSMKEHNGGRRATMSVKVSVTIQ
jgi:hypothetical protein